MNTHWIDNLSGDWERRLRNKYHKFRYSTAGLPFRDYVCRPDIEPISTFIPCDSIATLVESVSSLQFINIGEIANDHNGHTIFEGLQIAQNNLNIAVNILSGVDSYIRTNFDVGKLSAQTNTITIPLSDVPSDINIGQWISRENFSYTLAVADDAFSRLPGLQKSNTIGVITDIDNTSQVCLVTTAGIVSGVYSDLDPGVSYYISTTAGDMTSIPDQYNITKPVLNSITSDVGIIDIKVGEYHLDSTLRRSNIFPDCIPYISPIQETEIKIDEITSEATVTLPTPGILDKSNKPQILSDITGEVSVEYVLPYYTHTYRGINEIASEMNIEVNYDVTGSDRLQSSDIKYISSEVTTQSINTSSSIDDRSFISISSAELNVTTPININFLLDS